MTDADGGFELAVDEHVLLEEVCRTLDLIDALQRQLDADGPMTRGAAGQPVLHPAVTAVNASRQLVGRLLAQLRLPDDDGEASVVSPASARARNAAQVRWALDRQRQGQPARGRRGSA